MSLMKEQFQYSEAHDQLCSLSIVHSIKLEVLKFVVGHVLGSLSATEELNLPIDLLSI
jgi:hypothetical protein